MPPLDPAAVATLIRAGASVSDVAAQLRAPARMVRRAVARARAAGDLPPAPGPAYDRERALALLRGGVRPADVARELGVSAGAIRSLAAGARAAGEPIPKRPGGRASWRNETP